MKWKNVVMKSVWENGGKIFSLFCRRNRNRNRNRDLKSKSKSRFEFKRKHQMTKKCVFHWSISFINQFLHFLDLHVELRLYWLALLVWFPPVVSVMSPTCLKGLLVYILIVNFRECAFLNNIILLTSFCNLYCLFHLQWNGMGKQHLFGKREESIRLQSII